MSQIPNLVRREVEVHRDGLTVGGKGGRPDRGLGRLPRRHGGALAPFALLYNSQTHPNGLLLPDVPFLSLYIPFPDTFYSGLICDIGVARL